MDGLNELFALHEGHETVHDLLRGSRQIDEAAATHGLVALLAVLEIDDLDLALHVRVLRVYIDQCVEFLHRPKLWEHLAGKADTDARGRHIQYAAKQGFFAVLGATARGRLHAAGDVRAERLAALHIEHLGGKGDLVVDAVGIVERARAHQILRVHLNPVDAGANTEFAALIDLAMAVAGGYLIDEEVTLLQVRIQNHGVIQLRAVVELYVH